MAGSNGTMYELPHEPFVAFDIIVGSDRLVWNEMSVRVAQYNFVLPQIRNWSSNFNR